MKLAGPDEDARLEALRRLGVLDTPAEPLFDGLARSAAAACGTPMALIALTDRDRQWIKAQVGLPGVTEFRREASGPPNAVFLAGAPLVTPEGHVVGTLCVLDTEARPPLAPAQRVVLDELAGTVMQALLLRKAAHRTLQSSSEQMFRELSEAQQELRASNDFLARAEEIAGVGGWRMNLQTRELLWTSQVRRIYGLPADFQPRGDEHKRFFSPGAQAVIRSTADECLATGRPWDVLLPMVTAQGHSRWVRSIGQVEVQDNVPVALVGALQDVTDTQEARAALLESQERLRQALEGSSLALWDLDVGAGTIYLSETWNVMLGGPPMETRLRAEDLLKRVPVDELPRIQAALEPVLEGRSPRYMVQHQVRREDGSLMWCTARAGWPRRTPMACRCA